MKEEKENNKEYDIFITRKIFPEASLIFTTQLKSLEEIKDVCLFVIDTNALLVPYTISRKNLDQIEQVYLKLVNDKRLYIPGRVAREFAIHRSIKLGEIHQQLIRKGNIKNVQKGTYPLLESLKEYQNLIVLEKEIDIKINEYREEVQKIANQIRKWIWNDPVSLIYRKLFTESIIIDPDFDLEEIKTDLERRKLHRIPPGYKDSAKDDKGIGDLLIWHTILKIGEQFKKSITFVSGDVKTDWWHQSESQPLYPRYELVDEFRRHSGGQTFHIIKFSRFLEIFGMTESMIEEVSKEEKKIPQYLDTEEFMWRARHGVFFWMRKNKPMYRVDELTESYLDYIMWESKILGNGIMVFPMLSQTLSMIIYSEEVYRGYRETQERNLQGLTLFLVYKTRVKLTKDSVKIPGVFDEMKGIEEIKIVTGFLDPNNVFIFVSEFYK